MKWEFANLGEVERGVKHDYYLIFDEKVMVYLLFISVLNIHLILMRIRILDPHWKKMDTDPDPGDFFKN